MQGLVYGCNHPVKGGMPVEVCKHPQLKNMFVMLALNGSSITYNWLIVVDVFWQASFWKDPTSAIKEAYLSTDIIILNNAPNLGPGGSTAVTAILIDGKELLVANVGDSRAVLSRGGVAEQLSIDHEPGHPTERGKIENRGGFVSNMPGNVFRLS